MTINAASLDAKTLMRGGPIRWLILGGALLIAAIAVGATMMAENFRERALRNSERELENTVLLLARHFDQQLGDFQVIQKDLIDHMRSSGVMTAQSFRQQNVRPGRPSDAQIEIERIVLCRWRQRFRCRRHADQHIDGLAGALHQCRRPPLLQDLPNRSAGAGNAGRAGAQPDQRRLDHRDRPQVDGTAWRVTWRHRPRHRTGHLREILRIRGAGAGRVDFDAPPRRNAAGALPASRGHDRTQLQDRRAP